MTDIDELRRLQRDGSDELGWLLDLCLRWVREGRLTLACPRAVQRAWTRLQDERAELARLRSRVAELETDLGLERAKLNAMEHTVVDELTSPPFWPYDSTPDEPCSRINYLQHLRYLKARAARVAELGAKLAEAREVVRPFSETHEAAVVEAKADIWGRPVAPAKAYARAAEWLRGQEE